MDLILIAGLMILCTIIGLIGGYILTPKKKCMCRNVEMGNYENQVVLTSPFTKRVVGIDACIVVEIQNIWKQGIPTIESCCGHNKTEGYIAVLTKYHDKMIALGYKSESSNRKGFFKPKSV